MLLKEREKEKYKGQKYEEEEDVRSYWKTLRKRDNPGI
jgi:hypothetical protein